MFKKLSPFTLQNAYQKGFRGGSKVWRYGFFVGLVFKIIRMIFAKPAPKTFEQYDLQPGEYRVTVKETK